MNILRSLNITLTATRAAALFLYLLFVGEVVLAEVLSGRADECLPHQGAFLKEILLGRCYEQPPSNGGVSSCPSTVDSFMGIIEGRLDADLEPHHFDTFASSVDFGLGTDQNAVIFLPSSFQSCRSQNPFLRLIQSSTSYASVETTPGGALLAGLIFCGNGVAPQKACTPQTSHASVIFWKDVAYPAFAKSIRGELAAVWLGDGERYGHNRNATSMTDDTLLYLSRVDWTQVTHINLYAPSCDVGGAATNMIDRWKKEIFNGAHIPISCSLTGNFVSAVTGISFGDTDADNTSTKEAQTEVNDLNNEKSNNMLPSDSSRHHVFPFASMVLIVAVALMGYRAMKRKQQRYSLNGKYDPLPETVAWI